MVLSHSWVLHVEVGVTQGSLSGCPTGIWIYLGGLTYPHHLFSPLCGIASEESLCPAPLALAFKPGVSGGQRDLSLFIFHFLVISGSFFTSCVPFVLLVKNKICQINGPNGGAAKGVSREVVQLLLPE